MELEKLFLIWLHIPTLQTLSSRKRLQRQLKDLVVVEFSRIQRLFSRLSEFVGDEKPSLLDFDETLEFLKDHIGGRVDPSSNSNVKKTFQLHVARKPLDAAELGSFVAVTAKIGP
jgi:hypothetical protein